MRVGQIDHHKPVYESDRGLTASLQHEQRLVEAALGRQRPRPSRT
jgi:hypothetical protein